MERPGSDDRAVWVRPTAVEADEAALARARDEVRTLARLSHPALLRAEMAVQVGDKVGLVYPALDGNSFARILAGLRAARDVVPARSALEVLAQVGEALEALLRFQDGPSRGFHPGPGPEDLLLAAGGRLGVAGGMLLGAGEPPPWREASRPPTPSAPEAEASWSLGILLAELLLGQPPTLDTADATALDASLRRLVIRVLSRPGDNPGEGGRRLLEATLAWNPADRPSPGRFAARARELAAARPGPGLVEWTPTALARARGDTIPMEEPPEVRGGDRRAPSPLVASATMAPDVPSLPPPPAPPVAAAPVPVESLHGPMPTMVPDEPMSGAPRSDEPPGPPPLDPGVPVWGLPSPGGSPPAPHPRPVSVSPRGGPGLSPRPSPPPGQAPGMAGGPRIDMRAHALGDVPLAIDAPALPSLAPPAPRAPIGLVAGTAVTALVVVVGFAAWWSGAGEGETELVAPVPSGVETPPVDPTPPPPAPVAPPPAPVAPPPASPGPEGGAPAGVSPAPRPTPSQTSAAPPPPARPSPPREPAPTPEPEVPVADPDEPTRIVPVTAPPPASEPEVASEPAAAPAPAADPGPYEVSFTSGDPAVTSLEVRCGVVSRTGAAVSFDELPAGSCKVTGTGPDPPLITLVTVSADRAYTCFAAGARACR